jgi:hypothetical protein
VVFQLWSAQGLVCFDRAGIGEQKPCRYLTTTQVRLTRQTPRHRQINLGRVIAALGRHCKLISACWRRVRGVKAQPTRKAGLRVCDVSPTLVAVGLRRPTWGLLIFARGSDARGYPWMPKGARLGSLANTSGAAKPGGGGEINLQARNTKPRAMWLRTKKSMTTAGNNDRQVMAMTIPTLV